MARWGGPAGSSCAYQREMLVQGQQGGWGLAVSCSCCGDGQTEPRLLPHTHLHSFPSCPRSPVQVVAAQQCWQLMRGPAGDDIEITAEEGRTAELVRTALSALQVGANGQLPRHESL